jgi:hypothetical protein
MKINKKIICDEIEMHLVLNWTKSKFLLTITRTTDKRLH